MPPEVTDCADTSGNTHWLRRKDLSCRERSVRGVTVKISYRCLKSGAGVCVNKDCFFIITQIRSCKYTFKKFRSQFKSRGLTIEK
jgi:hypothetical protein